MDGLIRDGIIIKYGIFNGKSIWMYHLRVYIVICLRHLSLIKRDKIVFITKIYKALNQLIFVIRLFIQYLFLFITIKIT